MARAAALLPLAALSLAPPALGQTELFRLDGPSAGSEYGTSLAVLGDLDGDGADDYAVGAPHENGRTGVVRVHSGVSGAILKTLTGSAADDFFGQAVVALGDVDADGVTDFAVGASGREFDPGDCTSIPSGFGPPTGRDGYVVVYSGAAQAPLYTLPGPAGEDSGYGFMLGAGGDVNGGGPDLIVCGGLSQRADVFEGSSGALIRSHVFTGFAVYVHAADIVGDVDGDTRDDYVLGWVEQLYCYSGSVEMRSGLSGAMIWDDQTCGPGDEYGFNVAGIGDLDGNGLPDVYGCGLDNSGLACVSKSYVRALDGVSGALHYSSTGATRAGRGRAILGLGDLDGDGDGEVALGQPGIEVPGFGDDVRIESGTTGQLVLSIAPDADTDRFGCALAAGDVNGDGLLDLLVGARWDDDGGADAGSVRIFSIFLGPTAYCAAEPNSQGCLPGIFATGTPSIAGSSLRVKATGVLNNKAGLMFWGAAPKQTPFGTAFRCVVAPTVRTPLQNSAGNPPPDDCSGSFSFHFNKPYMLTKGLTAGDAIYCQYWSRDPQSPSTTNFTDALAFAVLP